MPPSKPPEDETAETPCVDHCDSADHTERPESREEPLCHLGPDSPQIVRDMTAHRGGTLPGQVLPEVIITEGDSSKRVSAEPKDNKPANGSGEGSKDSPEGSSGSKPSSKLASADSSSGVTNGTENQPTHPTQIAHEVPNLGAKPAQAKSSTAESGSTGDTVSALETSIEGAKPRQAIKPAGESDTNSGASQTESKGSESNKHNPSERIGTQTENGGTQLPHAAKRAPEVEGEKEILNQQAKTHEQPPGSQLDAVLPPAVPKAETANKPRNEDSEGSKAQPLSQLINQPQSKDSPKEVIPGSAPGHGESTETIPGVKKPLNAEKGGLQDFVAFEPKRLPLYSELHADSKQPDVLARALSEKNIIPTAAKADSPDSGSPEKSIGHNVGLEGPKAKETIPSPGDTLGSGVLQGIANTTRPFEPKPGDHADPKGKDGSILPLPEKGKNPEASPLSTLLDNANNPQNLRDAGRNADAISTQNKDQAARLDNRISDTVKAPEFRSPDKETAEPKDLGPKPVDTRLSEVRPQDYKTEIGTPEFKKDRTTIELKVEPVQENKKKDDDKSLEHERLLQQLFANSVPVAPKVEKDETPPLVSTVIRTSHDKYEMASTDKESKNPITQLINRIESVVENKLSNMVSSVGDKGNNSSETRTVSAAQTPSSKTELPLFQNPIMRINEIASELKRASVGDARNIPADAGNKASKLNSGEAMSLKDLIAASRQLDPNSSKGVPIDVKGILPHDGKTSNEIGTGKTKVDASKIDELPVGEKSGKIDPVTGIKTGANLELDNKDDKKGGLKGSDAQPDGRKVQDLTDGGSLEEEEEDDDADSDEDKKDILEQNSDQDKEILNLILAGKKKKDVELDESHDSEDKSATENETRRKYTVQQGDTLQSIAKSILGDSRFDQLLEMVNRGQLKYQSKNGEREVVLKVGQIIWLPTTKEVKVFAGLYFSKKSNNKVLADDELIQTISKSIEEVASKYPSTDSNKESEIDFTPIEKRKKKSRPTFSPSEQYSTGEWKEIEQFLNKLKDIAEHKHQNDSKIYFQSKDVELPLVAEDNVDIKILSTDTRIVIEYTCDGDDEEVFHARLERQYDTEWQTIAYYQSSASKAFRYLHKQNGGRKTFQLHIPNSIVREMAVKDLSRNWRSYVAEFESADLRNVVHTVPAK